MTRLRLLFFIVRSVGGDPPFSSIAFLGGVSAVGAIVAVLAVFAPSGLGPREATMYGLLLAVTSNGAALAATALNRIAITLRCCDLTEALDAQAVQQAVDDLASPDRGQKSGALGDGFEQARGRAR